MSKIVCTCLELTRDDFVRAMSENRALDFDQLLARTGAGMKCTACRLDLETIYVDAYDSAVGQDTRRDGTGATARRQPSLNPRYLLRSLLRFVDRFAPPHPVLLRDFSPVLAGHGISQSVLVANDPLMFDGKGACSPMEATVVLRNALGDVLTSEIHRIDKGEAMEVELSTALLKDAVGRDAVPDDGNVWGSVEVRRRWRKPSMRGTTRPQLLVRAAGGTGGVHTQGPAGSRTDWYTVLARPAEERSFVTVVNAAGGVLRVRVNIPKDPSNRDFVLPGYGARGIEIATDSAGQLDARTFGVSIHCDGPSKTHVWTASPAMDHVAIDHPAES